MKTIELADALRRFSDDLPVQLEDVFAASGGNATETWLPEFQKWRDLCRVAPELAMDPAYLRRVAVILTGLAISRIGVSICGRPPMIFGREDIELFDRGGGKLVLGVLADLIETVRRLDTRLASEMSERAAKRLAPVLRKADASEWRVLKKEP